MDQTEDLSARVLLRAILSTEPPRSPITRSVSKSTRATRRSSRILTKKDAGAQTPQTILRRSLKRKLSKSATRKSQPAPERGTTSAVGRTVPVSTSMLFDDGDTPRTILKNILQTEPVKSPLVHNKGPSEKQGPPSPSSSTTRKRLSVELLALDLPDATISNVTSPSRRLRRKRTRRSLNLSALEKRADDSQKTSEDSLEDMSSLSTLSTSSVRLHTPVFDSEVEERGQRTADRRFFIHHRRTAANKQQARDSQDSEEDLSSLSTLSTSSVRLDTPVFDSETEKRAQRTADRRFFIHHRRSAANKQQTEGTTSDASVERDPSETHYSEGLTLGLSKLSEPDVTMDIVNCITALYDPPNAMNSNLSIIATQDKPTVTGSQAQRVLESGLMDMEHAGQEKNASGFLFLNDDKDAAAPGNGQHVSRSLESIDETQEDKDEKAGVCRPEGADKLPSELEERALESQTEFGEDANRVETQTEDDSNDDIKPEDDIGAGSDSEEENVPNSQTDEEAAETQTDEVAADSESQGDVKTGSESDEDLAESQTEEEAAVDSQPQEDGETGEEEEGEVELQSEEEPGTLGQESAEDEDGPECQTEGEEDEAEHQTEEAASVAQSQDDVEAASQSEEADIVESQNEDENDGEREDHKQLDHISRRSHRSEGALILPLRDAGEDVINTTAEGMSEADSKAHGMFDVPSNLDLEVLASSMFHLQKPESASGPDEALGAEKPCDANEESFHQDEASEHPSFNSADEAALQSVSEQEEECDDEDEENEEVPSKTPAFVREKRIFFYRKPSTSISVLTNSQASSSQTNEALPAAKPKQVRRRKTRPAERQAVLPKSYLMGVFKHFAKTNVAADVHPFLNDVMDVFFDRVALDLEAFAAHAKRKTIEVEDVVLLLKRQGYVNDEVPVEVLIEKYLRMDQRKLLIPIATSGNVVIPKKR